MRTTRVYLVALVVTLTASVAHADLSSARASNVGASAFERGLGDGIAAVEPARLDLWPESLASAIARGVPVAEEPSAALQIREGPSSLSLYLSVLLSVGGWHFVRSARHLHLASAPDWYHTGGPVQVAHATPLDPSFDMPLLSFFEIADQDELALFGFEFEDDSRAESQTRRGAAAPRGPPLPA